MKSILLTVRRCSGLEAGLYRYDPQVHQLLRLSELSEACQQLLPKPVVRQA